MMALKTAVGQRTSTHEAVLMFPDVSSACQCHVLASIWAGSVFGFSNEHLIFFRIILRGELCIAVVKLFGAGTGTVFQANGLQRPPVRIQK